MKTAKKNWKTTILGIITLGLTGFQIYTSPATATSPETMTAIAAGIGLIVAKDGDQTGK